MNCVKRTSYKLCRINDKFATCNGRIELCEQCWTYCSGQKPCDSVMMANQTFLSHFLVHFPSFGCRRTWSRAVF